MTGEDVRTPANAAERAQLRAGVWPPNPEEEQSVATLKVTLPPMTTAQRWELAEFLDDTAKRTGIKPNSPLLNAAGYAVWRFFTDLAEAAREARGKQVASAQDALRVPSEVTLTVKVPDRDTRAGVHAVLKVARDRAEGARWVGWAEDTTTSSVVAAAMGVIAGAFEPLVPEPGRFRRR